MSAQFTATTVGFVERKVAIDVENLVEAINITAKRLHNNHVEHMSQTNKILANLNKQVNISLRREIIGFVVNLFMMIITFVFGALSVAYQDNLKIIWTIYAILVVVQVIGFLLVGFVSPCVIWKHFQGRKNNAEEIPLIERGLFKQPKIEYVSVAKNNFCVGFKIIDDGKKALLTFEDS
jgi:hypothetical protein